MDGRPLSAERGTARQIAALYKSYIRSASGSPTIISNPFMCLHIRCPPGSYDVNIEPAKDDVLLEDQSSVMSLVGDLFADIYGSLNEDSTENQTASMPGSGRSHNEDFGILLTRKGPSEHHTDRENAHHVSGLPEIATPSLQFNSRGGVTKRSQHIPQSRTADEEARNKRIAWHAQNRGNTNHEELPFLNPWTISRMNISFLSPEKSQSQTEWNRQFTTSARRPSFGRKSAASPQRIQNGSRIPPSPASNAGLSTNVDHPPISTRLWQHPSSGSTQESQGIPYSEGRANKGRGSGLLEHWIRGRTAVDIPVSPAESFEERDPSFSRQTQERFVAHRRWPDCQTASAVQHRERSYEFQSPESNVSHGHVQTPESLDPVIDKSQELGGLSDLFRFQKSTAILHQSADMSSSSEVREALDFERRKKEAMQKRREYMRGLARQPIMTNDQEVPSPSPHQSRYLAARAALAPSGPTSMPAAEDMSDSSRAPVTSSALNVYDPRAYLIRMCDRNTTGCGQHQMKRMQTSKLPFETVPRESQLHNVRLTIAADQELISTALRQTRKSDMYMQHIDGPCAWEAGQHTESWERRLSMLVRDIYCSNGQNGEEGGTQLGDISFNIRNVLTQHLSTDGGKE